VYADRIRWDLAESQGLGSGGEQGFDRREFAPLWLRFKALAVRAGFAAWSLPVPGGVSCVSLLGGNLTIGSEGEIYPCSGYVGDRDEVVGDLGTSTRAGSGEIFPGFDPFADVECRACAALPLCMGGCPHDAISLDRGTRANRCFDFLHSFHGELSHYAEAQEAKR
jgi:uncharacterized protein